MRVYGVLLTDQGWEELGEALEPYAQKGTIGKFLYPNSVDTLGYFCHMEVAAVDGSGFEAEINIPNHYVKFIVATAERRQIGFIHAKDEG